MDLYFLPVAKQSSKTMYIITTYVTTFTTFQETTRCFSILTGKNVAFMAPSGKTSFNIRIIIQHR